MNRFSHICPSCKAPKVHQDTFGPACPWCTEEAEVRTASVRPGSSPKLPKKTPDACGGQDLRQYSAIFGERGSDMVNSPTQHKGGRPCV